MTASKEKAKIAYVEGNLFDIVPDKLTIGEAETIYVPHVVNNVGAWGAGFVVPLGQKWPASRDEYLKAYKAKKIGDKPFKLGQTQFVEVVPGRVHVCNMIGQVAPGSERIPLKYEALESCMEAVRDTIEEDASNFPVICAPLFGAGLAGGEWPKIEAMIQRLWADNGTPVTIYYMRDRLPPGWTPPKDAAT